MPHRYSGIRILPFLFLFLFLFSFTSFVTPAGAAPPEHSRAPAALADLSLQVRSWEQSGLLEAEVEGRLDYPYATVRATLTRPQAWSEILPLVFNIKSCTWAERDGSQYLTVYVGRKFYEPPEESYRLDYHFQVREEAADRFRILLYAAEGPHGTGDYRIEVAARAEGSGRTALKMHSSFRPSLRSKLATRVYLATAGRDKVGFSIEGYDHGEPVYVGGTGGIVERNAMRYYLALEAYLETLSLPPQKRFDARLHAWYDRTAQYPRQLYEMDKEEYLSAKRKERKQQLELQEALSYRGEERQDDASS